MNGKNIIESEPMIRGSAGYSSGGIDPAATTEQRLSSYVLHLNDSYNKVRCYTEEELQVLIDRYGILPVE